MEIYSVEWFKTWDKGYIDINLIPIEYLVGLAYLPRIVHSHQQTRVVIESIIVDAINRSEYYDKEITYILLPFYLFEFAIWL